MVTGGWNFARVSVMAKFGRYEFGKTEPTEVYEGDYMRQDKGIVSIFRGTPGGNRFSRQTLLL